MLTKPISEQVIDFQRIIYINRIRSVTDVWFAGLSLEILRHLAEAVEAHPNPSDGAALLLKFGQIDERELS